MAKFVSKLIEAEVIYPNGQKKPGRVAWVPVDDAAKVTRHAEAALAEGAWTPADPKEIEKAKARVASAKAKEDKRRGRG
jgi:predicted RNA-binding protein YlxR (DUF448 family)